MPVLGHAFVGLATAIQTEPAADRDGVPLSPLTAAVWTAAVVGFAYLPDVVTQIGASVGAPHATLAGHSMIVGAAAGIVLGGVFAAISGTPIVRMVLVAVGSILGHDLLDLLQGSDRPPLWPWSMKTFVSAEWIPTRTTSEGLLFLALFLAFAGWRIRSGRSFGALTACGAGRQPPLVRWSTYGAIAAIVAAAVATLVLRSRHERLLNSASHLLDAGQYEAALRTADKADGWPRAARPGRVDLIRAEAFAGLGESRTAEALYLRAYDEDPTNFWAVADIAEFYASSDRPIAERRTLVDSYVTQLRERFAGHRALPRVLDGIERRLTRGAVMDSGHGVAAASPAGRNARSAR